MHLGRLAGHEHLVLAGREVVDGEVAERVHRDRTDQALVAPQVTCDLLELPVLEISKVLAGHPQRTADWKVAGLQAAFAGHPLVWVDDFGADRRGESTYGDPPAPMLVVAPEEAVGLTSGQSAEVLEFVARWGRGRGT